MPESEPIKTPMTKTHDYIHHYQGHHITQAICRIRIYERSDAVPTIIATELPDNPGISITNMVEFLAAEIIARHFPSRFEEYKPITWVELYPPIIAYGRTGKTLQYSLVDFDSYRPRLVYRFGEPRVCIGQPEWRHVEPEEVERILGGKPD